MTNLFFKSANRLIKNSPITFAQLDVQLKLLLKEQRNQRSDLKIVNGKLDRLMVDKHLQLQVDEYFENHDSS